MEDQRPTHCPTCRKRLERHPIMGYWSCFLHGDYVPKRNTWEWNAVTFRFRNAR